MTPAHDRSPRNGVPTTTPTAAPRTIPTPTSPRAAPKTMPMPAQRATPLTDFRVRSRRFVTSSSNTNRPRPPTRELPRPSPCRTTRTRLRSRPHPDDQRRGRGQLERWPEALGRKDGADLGPPRRARRGGEHTIRRRVGVHRRITVQPMTDWSVLRVPDSTPNDRSCQTESSVVQWRW